MRKSKASCGIADDFDSPTCKICLEAVPFEDIIHPASAKGPSSMYTRSVLEVGFSRATHLSTRPNARSAITITG